MSEKTLGQIAFEARHGESLVEDEWRLIPEDQRRRWEHAADTVVAHAFKKVVDEALAGAIRSVLGEVA